MSEAHPDYRPEVGVIGLVPEAWGPQWQQRHQVLRRLAQRCPTVWMNPAHGREAALARWRNGPPVWQAVPGSGLDVYTPEWWLPHLHRSPLREASFRRRLRRARRHLERQGCRRFVLSVWRPQFAAAADLLPHDALLYHVNDEYTFRDDDPPVSPKERHLLARADATIFCSRTLMERKARLARHAVYIPNGVDFAALAGPHPVPADLAAIPRPRIGYTGWVKEQLDWRLINTLATRHPDWSFVLVGPTRIQPEIADLVAEAERHANIHFLGMKPVDEFVTYPGHFDVCVMPYLVNGYTRYIYPLKLHEYLATGRPVVSSPIDAVHEFAAVVSLADGAEAWSRTLADALQPAAQAEPMRAARQAVAREHDWDTIVGRVAQELFAALD